MNKTDYLKRYQDNSNAPKGKVTYQNKPIKDQDNMDILMMHNGEDKEAEEDYQPIFVETIDSLKIDQSQKKQVLQKLIAKSRSRSKSQASDDDSDEDSDDDSDDDASSDLSVQRQQQPQQTVYRDAKTGQRITLEEKMNQEQSKHQKIVTDRQQIVDANRQRIQMWSKGLVQQQQKEEIIKQQNEPEVDAHKERELHFIRQQKFDDPMRLLIQEEDDKMITVSKSQFLLKCKFPTIPNRFGISAGHRWDGVDRSNTYESKFLASINERKDQEIQKKMEQMKDL